MNPDVKEVEKSTLVMRLERNQNDLQQLKSKLDSYICEPKTYSLFERIESLRSRLENLSRSNSEIIKSLRTQKKSVETNIDDAKEQFQKFNLLQKGIEEYVSGIRNS